MSEKNFFKTVSESLLEKEIIHQVKFYCLIFIDISLNSLMILLKKKLWDILSKKSVLLMKTLSKLENDLIDNKIFIRKYHSLIQ